MLRVLEIDPDCICTVSEFGGRVSSPYRWWRTSPAFFVEMAFEVNTAVNERTALWPKESITLNYWKKESPLRHTLYIIKDKRASRSPSPSSSLEDATTQMRPAEQMHISTSLPSTDLSFSKKWKTEISDPRTSVWCWARDSLHSQLLGGLQHSLGAIHVTHLAEGCHLQIIPRMLLPLPSPAPHFPPSLSHFPRSELETPSLEVFLAFLLQLRLIHL